MLGIPRRSVDRTPEERAIFQAYRRALRANSTPEEKALRAERNRQRMKKHRTTTNTPANYKKLGITRQDYERMLEAQGGGCAICKKEPGERKLHVDHCHKTMVIRGVLCYSCNTKLGWYEKYLSEVATYLARRPEVLLRTS